jgi:hypothetical protein
MKRFILLLFAMGIHAVAQSPLQPSASPEKSMPSGQSVAPENIAGHAVVQSPGSDQVVIQPAGTSTSISAINGEYLANLFSGSDIGAKINAAYAAMPNTGGVIVVQVPPSGMSFETPIKFAAVSKPVIVDCRVNQVHSTNAMLKFTPTTGIAVTFNFNNGHTRGFGMKNCMLSGNGGRSTGMFLGGSNGAEGIEISNTSIKGFGTNVNFGSNTYLTLFKNVYIAFPSPGGECLNFTNNSNSGEQMTFENVTFDGCGVGGIVVGGSGTQLNCDNCSFDDSQFATSGAQIVLKSPHFEDPGGTHFPFISVSGGNLYLLSPTFATDSNCMSSCPTAPIVQTAGNLTVTGLTHNSFYNYSGFISISGSASFYELAPLQIIGLANPSAPVVGTTTGLWIFDTGTRLPWQSLLTNHLYGVQGPGIQSSTDAFMRTGSYLEGGKGTENYQWRGMGTPDGNGFYNGKIRVANAGSGACDSYASALQFFTENTNTASSKDLSTQVGQFDCRGNLHVLGNIYVGNATGGTPGVTKTCTVLPTVVNGIITSC